MPCVLLIHLVLRQFSHRIKPHEKLHDCRNLLSCEILKEHFLKIYDINPMSCASKFSSHMTTISNFIIVIINEFFTNPASITPLKSFFFFFRHDQFFVKMFFHCYLTILMLLKNWFNKFISSIFASIHNYWFGKFIININKLVRKSFKE